MIIKSELLKAGLSARRNQASSPNTGRSSRWGSNGLFPLSNSIFETRKTTNPLHCQAYN